MAELSHTEDHENAVSLAKAPSRPLSDFQGVPSYTPGTDLGAFIYVDDGTWCVFCSGDSKKTRNWKVRINAWGPLTEAPFQDVEGVALEKYDKLKTAGNNPKQHIIALVSRFNFKQDGVCFRLSGEVSAVRFNVIDLDTGEFVDPSLVFLGSQKVSGVNPVKAKLS